MSITSLIRKAQKATGLSLNALADEVGISRRVIRYYLSGDRNPRLAVVRAFERIITKPLTKDR